MIVQVLADEGVDAIFGYCGGAILPTYDAVFLYNARHARNGRAADAADRAGQRAGRRIHGRGLRARERPVGVCLVTSGPGATNTVTPVRDSHGRLRAASS